jgi:hypothetical protein
VNVRFVCVSRRTVVWLLTLPLAVVGSQLAHGFAFRLVTPDEAERAHELATTGHSYLVYGPVVVAVAGVLVVLALVSELGHVLRDGGQQRPGPRALAFAGLAPAIFVAQEHLERLLYDGVFPWDAVLQPTLLVGLLLQLPFAAVAYVLAHLLLGGVRSLGRLLSGPLRARLLACSPSRPARPVTFPRIPALARGYGSRGPPSPLR